MIAIGMRRPRLSLREYIALVKTHFLKYWKGYTIPLVVLFILQLFVRIDVNITESLPDHAFLTIKGWKTGIKTGDYVAFEYQGTGPASPFPKGFHFIKIVGGVPGDLITMDENRNFYNGDYKNIIGHNYLGTAKTHSKAGKVLEHGPVGVIPEDHYYVQAPHPDSLDSRYALTGWVSKEHIIGKSFAFNLF